MRKVWIKTQKEMLKVGTMNRDGGIDVPMAETFVKRMEEQLPIDRMIYVKGGVWDVPNSASKWSISDWMIRRYR